MSLAKKNFIINAVFVTVIAVALIVVLSFTGRALVRRDVEDRLKAVVRRSADQVGKDYFDEKGEFEGCYITYFNADGEYVGGYRINDESGNPVGIDNFAQGEPPEGVRPAPQDGDSSFTPPEDDSSFSPPDGFRPDLPVDNDNFRRRDENVVWQSNVGGVEYYVCEAFAVDSAGNLYVVRGLVPVGSAPLNVVLAIFVGATLALAAVALILSYISLRNATKPIRKMTEELDRVENSSDLSNRIDVQTTDPDIQNLCNAYNRMLGRVEEIVKSQERFTSDVSHELRSPLTVLLAESEFALNDLKTVEEKDKSLEAIYTQAKRLTVMVKQLLDFSRVAGLESVQLMSTDISALTAEIVNARQTDKNVTIHCDVQDGIVIETDETLFIRMVTNLIDNAVKYGKEGGNVWVTLKSVDGVTLSIKDDGIGMDEETLSHIYERMYQADKSRSAGGGLGLGLSFVKEISRVLGCVVSVESEPDKGSTFTIKF